MSITKIRELFSLPNVHYALKSVICDKFSLMHNYKNKKGEQNVCFAHLFFLISLATKAD